MGKLIKGSDQHYLAQALSKPANPDKTAKAQVPMDTKMLMRLNSMQP